MFYLTIKGFFCSRMSRHHSENCKVYVGDLPKDASEKELERVFREFGSLRSVWVARNPPGFAFVEFDDERDAEDAVKSLDGRFDIFFVCQNIVMIYLKLKITWLFEN